MRLYRVWIMGKYPSQSGIPGAERCDVRKNEGPETAGGGVDLELMKVAVALTEGNADGLVADGAQHAGENRTRCVRRRRGLREDEAEYRTAAVPLGADARAGKLREKAGGIPFPMLQKILNEMMLFYCERSIEFIKILR
jgi:hypothetical protein